jgi:ssDNA-binding replication factor A large subunit
MKISELQANSSFDELKVRILSKQGPREVSFRDGRTGYVWDIEVVDETGTTNLTLWGATAADSYKVGHVVSITNGWCKEWNNQKQISLGRSGNMTPAEDDPNIPTSPP